MSQGRWRAIIMVAIHRMAATSSKGLRLAISSSCDTN